MKKRELVKRYTVFLISLFFVGLGIALTKHSELGVSPISSVANVVSIKYTFLSFGEWVTVSNIVMLAGQVLLLRRNFKPIQLLQLPLSFLNGYFADLGLWIVNGFPNETYASRLFLVLAGIAVLGFGIALGVIADVLLNSAEAFVKALADVAKKDFGNTKIFFDVSWVSLSIVLSLLFFDGRLVGTREGTVMSAVLVGGSVKIFIRLLRKPLIKLVTK